MEMRLRTGRTRYRYDQARPVLQVEEAFLLSTPGGPMGFVSAWRDARPHDIAEGPGSAEIGMAADFLWDLPPLRVSTCQ
jgi:hypothetical protein